MAKKTIIIITMALLLTVFWLDINAGYKTVTLMDFVTLIRGRASASLQLTIVEFRLPRVMMSMLVGIGLAVAGCVMQGVTRNDLADPGILGINAGAGLMAALIIAILGSNLQAASIGVSAAAFTGGIMTGMVVYLLSYIKGQGISPNRLVLTGIAIATALNAATIILLLRMRQAEYGFIAGWLAGNIWGANWANIQIAAPVIMVLLAFVFYKSRTLNVMTLGYQAATGLGVRVNRESLILLTAAVGLSSTCVAVGGGVAFIGLICPHLSRRLVGSGHRWLIPMSALTGAVLMLIADTIGRTIIAPEEVSVGVVATIIGTPYFLYLLVKKGG